MAEQGTVRNGGDLLSDLKQLLRTSEGEEHLRKALFGASEISLDAFRSALANPEVGLPHPANDAITKELFDMLDITGSGSLMSDELFQALKPEPGPVSTDPPANSAAPPGEQATSGGAAVKPAVPLEAPVSQAESANKIAPAVKAAATPPTSEPQAVSATSTAAAPPPTAPSDPLPAAVQAGLDQLPATLPSAPEAPAPIPVVPVDSVSVSQAHPAAALAQAQASDSTAHKVAAVSSDGENVGSVGGVVPPSVPQAQEQKKEQDQKEQEQALAQVQQQRSMAMLQDALRSKSDSLLSELREMDANKDGHISAREFCRAVAKLDGLVISQAEAAELFQHLRSLGPSTTPGTTAPRAACSCAAADRQRVRPRVPGLDDRILIADVAQLVSGQPSAGPAAPTGDAAPALALRTADAPAAQAPSIQAPAPPALASAAAAAEAAPPEADVIEEAPSPAKPPRPPAATATTTGAGATTTGAGAATAAVGGAAAGVGAAGQGGATGAYAPTESVRVRAAHAQKLSPVRAALRMRGMQVLTELEAAGDGHPAGVTPGQFAAALGALDAGLSRAEIGATFATLHGPAGLGAAGPAPRLHPARVVEALGDLGALGVGDLAALLATASGRTQQAAAERVRDMVGGSAGHSRRLQTEAGRCSPGAGVLTGLARLVFGPGGAARGAALAALAELVYDHEANAAAVVDAPGLVQRVATFLSGTLSAGGAEERRSAARLLCNIASACDPPAALKRKDGKQAAQRATRVIQQGPRGRYAAQRVSALAPSALHLSLQVLSAQPPTAAPTATRRADTGVRPRASTPNSLRARPREYLGVGKGGSNNFGNWTCGGDVEFGLSWVPRSIRTRLTKEGAGLSKEGKTDDALADAERRLGGGPRFGTVPAGAHVCHLCFDRTRTRQVGDAASKRISTHQRSRFLQKIG